MVIETNFKQSDYSFRVEGWLLIASNILQPFVKVLRYLEEKIFALQMNFVLQLVVALPFQ